MKSIFPKIFLSILILPVIISACNGDVGNDMVGVQNNVKQSLAKQSTKSGTLDSVDQKYHALSISQPWQDSIHGDNWNVFVAHQNGIYIGQISAAMPNSVRWKNNISVPGGINDIKVCPQQIGQMIVVGVGNKGKIILISHVKGPTQLDTFKTSEVSLNRNQEVNWTSVTCVENLDGMYIALAGHDKEFIPYVAGYFIAASDLAGRNIVNKDKVSALGASNALTQFKDEDDEIDTDFQRVHYVRYQDNGNSKFGLTYTTKAGEGFTNDLHYVGLMPSSLKLVNDDPIYSSIPTDDLREDAITSNRIPIINISSIGKAKMLDSFSFFIDSLKISGAELASAMASTTVLIDDPLGQGVVPGAKPLIPIFSSAACNNQARLCLFSFHNLDSNHSQSIIVGVSSKDGKKLFDKKSLNVGEDTIITAVDSIPQSDGEFLELGGNGSLFRRKCSNNICDIAIEMSRVPK